MQRVRAVAAALAMSWFAWLHAGPAAGVLFASGDGTGNTGPPPDDPGFAHVGVVNGLTGICLGDGWGLTANHVGIGSLTLQGVAHPAVPTSGVRLQYGPGVPTDLRLFRLVTDPGLPPLEIAAAGPNEGAELGLVAPRRTPR